MDLTRTLRRGALAPLATAALLLAGLGAAAPAAATTGHENPLDARHVQFYVEPDTNAADQAATWAAEGRTADAAAMRSLAKISQAIWFTKGTPAEVRGQVHEVVTAAARAHQVPVLAAYYIPGRDCSQYSAGGAPSEQAYRQWISAFAKGIGGRRAVVILEPDGLALLSSEAWCGEGGGGSTGLPEDFSLVDERFREVNYAITTLRRQPRTAVYIDSGHSAWQQINDYDAGFGVPNQQLGMASRLLKGGIAKADGFFLNVSNYRSDAELAEYGTNLSKCLAFRMRTGATTCTDADIAAVPNDARRLTHFVVDTSRNGQGPWTPPAGVYTDAQDWCNPPGRGLGIRPTTDTGNPLIDARLWVKRPGESDGSCTRGTAGPEDPEYGIVDPAAGVWWADYALGLAQRANPPLAR
ncbi:MAG TPA: glycoside hydrolase family 6 protein [Streptosporangiaceae bacterium]|nr:glycoside hydrolase family 6 protein [Streptosporangiaceae bacterium]